MTEIAVHRGSNPLQNYLAIRRDPISFLTQVGRRSGPFVRFRILSFPYLLVNEPALIREALVEKHQTLIIKGGASAGLARLIGRGILTNRGRDWRQSRSSLNPLFQRESLERSVPITIRCVLESLRRWQGEIGAQPFVLNRELLALSFRIKSAALFDYWASFEEAGIFADAIWTLQYDGMNRYMSGLDYLPRLPLAINQRVDKARRQLYAIARKIHGTDASYPVDEILSLLFAGAESPANTLVWALKLLEEHPSWASRIEASGSVGPETSLSEVETFDAASQFLSETMRLYPAGWAFERYACEDVSLGGCLVEKGTRLLFSPYLLHRNPHFWQEPETFDPLRFSKGLLSADGVPRFAYLPFGAGPRSCIGSRLAMVEMKLTLKTLVSRWAWRFDGTSEAAALRPWGSFKIRVRQPVAVTRQAPPS